MGFRFRKTIKLFPGVKLNLSKSGISTSIGVPGATVNVSKRGTRVTVGIPGTGISYSEKLSGPSSPNVAPVVHEHEEPKSGMGFGTLLLWAVAGLFGLAFTVVLGNWLFSGKPATAPAPRLQSTDTTPVHQITSPPLLAASPVKSSPTATVKVEKKVASELEPADLPMAPSHLTTDLPLTGGQSMQRDLASLNQDERQSIDAVCMRAKFREGPAALKECQEKQLRSLSDGVQAPDLSGLSSDERQSIDAVCMRAKFRDGPAALHECQEKQLRSLRRGTAAPDLSGLTRDERQSIDAVCLHDKYQEGPAAFNRCLNNQFVALVAGPREPDLSGLTREERQSIDSVCLTTKYRQGPKAHNQCLINQLEKLHR